MSTAANTGMVGCYAVRRVRTFAGTARGDFFADAIAPDNNSVMDWIAAENADVVNERNCINIPLET